MSTINMVKYYFYKGVMPDSPELVTKLVALAYQTAREHKLYPKEVLIRSGFHNTTVIDGKRVVDPMGWHVTLCYKDNNHIARDTHVACHAYTRGKDIFELVQSTQAGEKSDNTRRQVRKGTKPVWPKAEELVEAPDVGYSHLPKP